MKTTAGRTRGPRLEGIPHDGLFPWLTSIPMAYAPQPEGAPPQDYPTWIADTQPFLEERLAAEGALRTLRRAPLLSLLMDVGPADTGAMERTVRSLVAQRYGRWELCAAIGRDSQPAVTAMLKRLARLDRRFRVKVIAPRGHPAGAPAALATAYLLAGGDLVGVMTPDDELDRYALGEIAHAVERLDADLVYTDEDRLTPGGRAEPTFKPAWSPELLESFPYTGQLTMMRRSLVDAVGGFRAIAGGELWDLVLRVSEKARIIHGVPRVLYHRRSVVPAGYARAESPGGLRGRHVMTALLQRRRLAGQVVAGKPGGPGPSERIRFAIRGRPRVDVIIPTRDRLDLLSRCLDTLEQTQYGHFRIVVVDNGSTEQATLRALRRWHREGRATVLRDQRPFNFSSLNNTAVRAGDAPFLVFLNNDTELVDPTWLSELLALAQRPGVGAVGPRLLYPDGRIQAGPVVLGLGGMVPREGVAGHLWAGLRPEEIPDRVLAGHTRNVSALTAACLLMPRRVFEEVGGFDERFPTCFGDVDLCLRIRRGGHRLVHAAAVTVVHHETSSRPREVDVDAAALMIERWGPELLTDPFHSPNLSICGTDGRLRSRAEAAGVAWELQARMGAAGKGADKKPDVLANGQTAPGAEAARLDIAGGEVQIPSPTRARAGRPGASNGKNGAGRVGKGDGRRDLDGSAQASSPNPPR